MAHRRTGDAASFANDIPVQWDPKDERRLVWKVDLVLMPIMTFSYGLQFVSVETRPLLCIYTVAEEGQV